MLVVVDPYPTVSAVMQDRKDGVYLLPACDPVRDPRFRHRVEPLDLSGATRLSSPCSRACRTRSIMAKFAKKFGWADRFFRNIEMEDAETPNRSKDITREFNGGMWTVGYTGQSPERIKLHMENQHTFDRTTLQAIGGPADGDYYGMPWPCWGTAEMGHPGTPNLYDMSKPVSEGGLTFRARFGVERDGENLLAEGVYSANPEIQGRLSRVHDADAHGPGLGR